MTEQSEHLSSAQIENYGNRSAGSGPGSAQRDEQQRVSDSRVADRHIDDQTTADQSIVDQRLEDQRLEDQRLEDQRVEAHLADCTSCRNRLLDFHRASFGLLADPQQLADVQVNTAPTPECLSDGALRQLAAGLTSEDVAAKITQYAATATGDAFTTRFLQHAATCDHCGPLLRTYTELFSDDFTPEEQISLANLQSSSASWQKNTARQMLQAARASAAEDINAAAARTTDAAGSSRTAPTVKSVEKPPVGKPAAIVPARKPFFWKWILIPATAAIVAIATFSIWYTQRDTPEKAEKLMAQAYTDQRKVEMRIPYANRADFVQTRSGESESRLNSPASLSRAAEQISEHLKKDPDDPKWLILSARLDLLDWNYKPALSSLEKISDAHIAESPDFLMTRAFALYEKSEVSKENQGYFEAVNLLAKALQKNPNDLILLFNQAIACEKIHAYECAQGDWKRFLSIEKDPGWISEARKHLQQIEEKKTLAP